MIALRKNNTSNAATYNSIFEPFFGFDDFGVKQANRNNYKILDAENEVKIVFSLPGFDKKDIEIAYEAGQLKVVAKLEEGSENYFGSTEQKFAFAIDQSKYDFDNAKAEFKNGILDISIPQLEAYSNKKLLAIK